MDKTRVPLVARPFQIVRRNHAVLAVCSFLLLAVGLVFGQTLRYGFVTYDDPEYVQQNGHVLGGLTVTGIRWALTHSYASNWHPLTWTSHMLDCQLYGRNPWGHHLTNVLLHAATAILLFLVLRQMSGVLWPSAFVAAVFAIHPLHVQSVAWVSERKDMLSGLFFMLTLGAYVWYARRPFSLFRYLLVMVFFALGLMSKPMLVTLPFVLLLLDYWPLRRFFGGCAAGETSIPTSYPASPGSSWSRGSDISADANSLRIGASTKAETTAAAAPCSFRWRLLMEKIPLLALAAASCLVTAWAQREAIDGGFGLRWRIGNALVAYVAYLRQLFYPVGLALFYPHLRGSLPIWSALGAFLLLLGISVGVLVWRRRYPYLLVGWFWYLGTLVPVIGLVQVGGQAMADRYTYLTQIGLYLALVWGVAQGVASWRCCRAVCGATGMLVLLLLMACAWRETSYWRSSEPLWEHTLANTSNNDIAHNNLAAVLTEQGRVDEAIIHREKVLELRPNDADAHNSLGTTLDRGDRFDEAIAQYRKALKINPRLAPAHNNLGAALARQGRIDEALIHFRRAVALDPADASAHGNFGKALAQQGRTEEAIIHFQRAVALNPEYASAHSNLGKALVHLGQVGDAVAHFRKVLEIEPQDAEAHENLALACQMQGAFQEAAAQYQEALKIEPHDIPTQNNFAWMLATCPEASSRDGKKAVELAKRAVELSKGGEPIFLDTLAAAYAEAGRFAEAVQTGQRALILATSQKNTTLADALRKRVRLYQTGAPFRETRDASP